jgi:hypothetical protein
MNVVLEGVRVGFVAGRTELVVVDELRIGNGGDGDLKGGKVYLPPLRLGLVGVGSKIWLAAARGAPSAIAAGESGGK